MIAKSGYRPREKTGSNNSLEGMTLRRKAAALSLAQRVLALGDRLGERRQFPSFANARGTRSCERSESRGHWNLMDLVPLLNPIVHKMDSRRASVVVPLRRSGARAIP